MGNSISTPLIKDVEEFFKLICLCHTVLPAQEDGMTSYDIM